MLRAIPRTILWLGLPAIISLSVLPQGAIPEMAISDKFGHLIVYGALALAGGLTYREGWPLFLVVLGLLLVGAGLELVQAFLPGRSASEYDLLANGIGILSGASVAIYKNHMTKRWIGLPPTDHEHGWRT